MRTGMGCALTLIVLACLACHTTKVVSLDMAPASNPVWLTLSDQSVAVVFGPKIYGNKLVGFVSGKYQEFPVADVKEVHVREPARGRTMALVAAGVVGFAAALYAAAGKLHSGSDTHITDICDEEPDNPICTM
jgi:hypothetical protein